MLCRFFESRIFCFQFSQEGEYFSQRLWLIIGYFAFFGLLKVISDLFQHLCDDAPVVQSDSWSRVVFESI